MQLRTLWQARQFDPRTGNHPPRCASCWLRYRFASFAGKSSPMSFSRLSSFFSSCTSSSSSGPSLSSTVHVCGGMQARVKHRLRPQLGGGQLSQAPSARHQKTRAPGKRRPLTFVDAGREKAELRLVDVGSAAQATNADNGSGRVVGGGTQHCETTGVFPSSAPRAAGQGNKCTSH